MSVFLFTQRIYRFFVPKVLRDRITKKRYDLLKQRLRKQVIRYLESLPKQELTNEKKVVLAYLSKNPFHIFPYDFNKKYEASNYESFFDQEKDLPYVFFESKKLYFKRGTDLERVKKKHGAILMEQDKDSPHLYLDEDFQVYESDVVVDIGVAEGNFALSVVDKVRELYLFETEPEWIEALEATFEPWKDKVHIVNKFVSNSDKGNFVSVDGYFANKKIDFLKIDVDGAERDLLKGAERTLSANSKLRMALCTYHQHHDTSEFDEMLTSYGFRTSFSKGYMIFHFDPKIKAPYLRRGLIRAVR